MGSSLRRSYAEVRPFLRGRGQGEPPPDQADVVHVEDEDEDEQEEDEDEQEDDNESNPGESNDSPTPPALRCGIVLSARKRTCVHLLHGQVGSQPRRLLRRRVVAEDTMQSAAQTMQGVPCASLALQLREALPATAVRGARLGTATGTTCDSSIRKRHYDQGEKCGRSRRTQGMRRDDVSSQVARSRLEEFQGEGFVMENNNIVCTGCGCNLSSAKSAIIKHISTKKHQERKAMVLRKQKNQVMLVNGINVWKAENEAHGDRLAQLEVVSPSPSPSPLPSLLIHHPS